MISQTKVVNIRKEPCDVYIGRPSKWGNPFKIGRDGTREEVIEKYRNYLLSNSKLLAHMHEVRGRVLGCYCKPLPCHGDVIAEVANKNLDRQNSKQ